MGKPISAVGIGNDEIRAELEELAEEVREMPYHWDVEVDCSFIAGCAQLQVTMARPTPPSEFFKFIFRNDLALVVMRETDDGDYEHCYTTLAVYHELTDLDE